MHQQERKLRRGATLAVAATAIAVALGTGATPGFAETATKAENEARSGGRITTDGSALARKAAAAISADTTFVAPESRTIRISAAGGTVSLSGSVGTIYDRELAARLAEGTPGVTGIRPSITIRPPSTVDASGIQAAVLKAIRDANVAGPTLDAKVQAGGLVDLNGEVTHEWTAIDAVKRVPGVTAIAGYEAKDPGKVPPQAEGTLAIVPPSPEQDAVIAEHVKQALQPYGGDSLQVTVSKGIVKLAGRARGLRESVRGPWVAGQVRGVLGIDNQVRVLGRAYHVGDTADAIEVRRQVLSSIRRSRASITDLAVVVGDGSVYLSGRARDEDTAYKAIEAAAAVPGVQEVVNGISYSTYGTGPS